MTMFRVGILGAGKMGRIYGDAFSRNEYCTVAAVYNRTAESGRELAARHGARYVGEWEELVRSPDIDLIGVCTPSNLHCAQVEAAAQAGKHILCEKPMANNHMECERMTRACKARGVTLMIGFQMRFHPVVRTVGEHLPNLGDIYHVNFNFGMYRPKMDWRNSLNQGGGALKELGSHLFDLCTLWVAPIAHLSCENNRVEPGREIEDHSIVLMRFANGATGYIYCGYEDRREPKICGVLMGRKGQINLTFSPYKTEDSAVRLIDETGTFVRDIPVSIPVDESPIYPGHCDSFLREIDHFVECIRNKEDPLVGGAEGRRSMEAVCAAYTAQRRGRKINLPPAQFEPGKLRECFPAFEAIQERETST